MTSLARAVERWQCDKFVLGCGGGCCQVLFVGIKNNFWPLIQHLVALFSLL